MFKNYFLTAWRNIVTEKVYSVINILGLAIGFASFLIIYQYVAFEKSLIRHEQMARKLRLQNRVELVDICFGRSAGVGNCSIDSELAELESGDEESG